MKIYVATYGSGGVIAAGVDEEAVKRRVEAAATSSASEFEWREDWDGQVRLHYRMAASGRWNKIPARYIEAVEVDDIEAVEVDDIDDGDIEGTEEETK